MSSAAILCVDDEIVILESLKEQLKRCFGDRFIYILIIVSDWLMPGIKGDEFLIQVHQKFPQLITIMLTGQADEAAIKRVKKEAKVYVCLDKPWTEKDLSQTIASALE